MPVSLADIAPHTELVAINGAEVECRGVGLSAIAYALRCSPEFRALINGEGNVDWNVETLLARAPDACHALIAAGLGELGNKEIEAAAARLVIEHQVALLSAIWNLSFPSGWRPFVERYGAALLAVLRDAPGPMAASITSSPKPPSD